MDISQLTDLNKNGFCVKNDIYTTEEITRFCALFAKVNSAQANFRQGKDLFAIRHVTEVYPELMNLVWNKNLKSLFSNFSNSYRLIKSLYFDKPPQSNWFVPWHQDLTISVKEEKELKGFVNWTHKNGVVGVQPPIHYLENIITCRIHLDDCNEENGGLQVLPQSHQQGVLKPQKNQLFQQHHQKVNCSIKAGGVLFMHPLLLHRSSKNRSKQHRKVLHLEFSSLELPKNLVFREEG